MKKLILMRHAKSSWADALAEDHDRVLNARGRAAAEAMGNWLRAQGHLPDEALVSDAARTRQTFARLGLDCAAQFRDALYHASAQAMLNVLQEARGDSVLMLGHNPGIADFAAQLVRDPPKNSRFHDYPTCATLVATFEIEDWRALRLHTGKTLDFMIPRDIES